MEHTLEPVATVQIVTLEILYAWSSDTKLHSIVLMPGASLSEFIRVWVEPRGTGTLVNWRVDEYAPIPF